MGQDRSPGVIFSAKNGSSPDIEIMNAENRKKLQIHLLISMQ